VRTPKVGLDGRLDLRGTLAAGPELVAKLSGGLLKSRATMTLPVEVAGTLSKPEVKLTIDPFDVGRKLPGL
jgi:AsmA protein